MQTPSSLRLIIFAAMTAMTHAQQVGDNTDEVHPTLTTQDCTKTGCTDAATSIALDANWRWLYKVGTTKNCYTGNAFDKTICADPKTCASDCALDGADYTGTYGITTEGDSLSLKLVTKGPYSTNIGSRVYLMESDDMYKSFKLLNKEFTFDVDVSTLGCGLNGAIYFVDMEPDGGIKRFPSNKAGAKYGTGYCDAQCPQDLKFISGEANVIDWTPSKIDSNAGTGKWGSCCAEMDILEANSISNAYTTHPCTTKIGGSHRCETAEECGVGKSRYDGVCDKDGCDFNPFRMGNKNFYGPGPKFTIDTTKKITVVTQFITSDNTEAGKLTEVKRFYIQNGVTHEMAKSTFPALKNMNSLTDSQCSAAKTLFGDIDDHKKKGGLEQMGEAMRSGMVLTMSLWTDNAAQCLWLDSDFPVDAPATKPGVSRGTCPKTSGLPKEVIAEQPDATIVVSNIRFGEIGSTVKGLPASSKATKATPAAATPEVGADADILTLTATPEVGADADASPPSTSCRRRR
ncbi:glycosyl hydrolase family 7 protein [Plasmopara halstedii]|uniref:cellulose 1,4-beta-cellobiosidase (non-reducing end) n=1 Tax=Plasmopara halstedii TaxID=4781 RepID=A0A0N7L7M0_PLAHL|nr:glycosyl hydrolase family 7 protein [Plasmopara halstedii]CEG47451.1 glycosyl hydrolase family 7 protein [Plasmopara halstedii]|eukprot:XP_024583820.1 glycosyl hydrolase family 7 protein [Plasmopara halstedii]